MKIKPFCRVIKRFYSSRIGFEQLSELLSCYENNLSKTGSSALLKDLLNYFPTFAKLNTYYKNYGQNDLNSERSDFPEAYFDIAHGHSLFYSQEGEDAVLARIFDYKTEGFFVDVGAHHPKRFSNTYYFYKSGWRGINIEPNAEVVQSFKALRPEDINLEVAIGLDEGSRDYFSFAEPALNTFSRQLADMYIRSGYPLIETRAIACIKLSTVLDRYLTSGTAIDFISIDVEDMELEVLQSNDWDKYRPEYVAVEILNFDLNCPEKFKSHTFLSDQGYKLFSKTFNTVIYKNSVAT